MKEMSDEAFNRVTKLYEKAEKKIKNGTYGTKKGNEEEKRIFVIKTKKREYNIKSGIAKGDISTIYGGGCDGDEFGEIAVKVIDDPADNDFMQNEIRILKIFQAEPGNQSKHLPVLLDQFRTSDSQLGIILRYLDAHDLHSVREKYKKGVPQEHVAWIAERLLSVLGFSHSKGIVHCNIEPAHIMVRPKDHNIFLIDWSYAAVNSAKTGEGFRVLNEDYSAPEVAKKKLPAPASDMYSAGKSLVYLLGGDVKTNKMPPIDERLKRFIDFLARESELQRAQDAWEMVMHLKEIRKEVFGEKRFLEFKI